MYWILILPAIAVILSIINYLPIGRQLLMKKNIHMGKWYCEYGGHIRIHDYFSIMINQFPILVIRRYDDPHSENENMDMSVHMGILGITFKIK